MAPGSALPLAQPRSENCSTGPGSVILRFLAVTFLTVNQEVGFLLSRRNGNWKFQLVMLFVKTLKVTVPENRRGDQELVRAVGVGGIRPQGTVGRGTWWK